MSHRVAKRIRQEVVPIDRVHDLAGSVASGRVSRGRFLRGTRRYKDQHHPRQVQWLLSQLFGPVIVNMVQTRLADCPQAVVRHVKRKHDQIMKRRSTHAGYNGA